MRNLVIAAASGAALVLTAAAPAAQAADSFRITGHGWGHGLGLSQYGAQGFAQHGYTAQQIATYYYQGSVIGSVPADATTVRVALKSGVSTARVQVDAAGAQVAAGGAATPLAVGDVVSVTASGATVTHPGAAAVPVAGVAGAAVVISGPDGSLKPLLTADNGVTNTHYRGSIRVVASGGTLTVVDDVALDSYLLSVVPGEMPSSWQPAALGAQALAARSYAIATRVKGGTYDLHADTRSQMYVGMDREVASTTVAVQSTAGQAITFGGQVIPAFFSSTSGGRTANNEDVWGGAARPYLRSVPDPYEASPYTNWAPLTFPAAQLQAKLGSSVKGSLVDVATTPTPSGRVSVVTVTGTGGTSTLTGSSFQSKLGLRSTWFAVDHGDGTAGTAPAAPTPVAKAAPLQLSVKVLGSASVTKLRRLSLVVTANEATTARVTLGTSLAKQVKVAAGANRIRFTLSKSAVRRLGLRRGHPTTLTVQVAGTATPTAAARTLRTKLRITG